MKLYGKLSFLTKILNFLHFAETEIVFQNLTNSKFTRKLSLGIVVPALFIIY